MHYGNVHNGVERTVGLSRVTWRVTEMTNGYATISSGIRIPGLALGVGPDFVGVSFGYTIRERMIIVPTKLLNLATATSNGMAVPDDVGNRWSVGFVRIATPPRSETVVVTGQAVAGLNISLDAGKPILTTGLRSAQFTTVPLDSDIHVEITDCADAWPQFDFTQLKTRFLTITNSNN